MCKPFKSSSPVVSGPSASEIEAQNRTAAEARVAAEDALYFPLPLAVLAF